MINPEVIQRQPEDTIADPVVHLSGDSRSHFRVQEQGGYITNLVLADQEVLYGDFTNKHRAKRRASHVMLPVGPYDGPGGQHGYPRWADYRVEVRQDDDGRAGFDLHLDNYQSGVDLAQSMTLDGDKEFLHELYLEADEPTGVSLGVHYYFRIKEKNIPSSKINGFRITSVLADEGISLDGFMHGEPCFKPTHVDTEVALEQIDLSLRRVTLNSTVPERKLLEKIPGNNRLETGYLLWHMPDTDSICIEPTVGFTPQTANLVGSNTGLILAPGDLYNVQNNYISPTRRYV